MRPATADQHATDAESATSAGCRDGSAEVAGLVAAAAAGDESAWERLVVLYGRRMYAMAKSRLGDPESAEEIVQSVFATLAEHLRGGNSAKYDERGRFESWLFRIVMNRVRDEGRRRQRRGETTVPLAFVTPDDQPVAHADQHAGLNGSLQTRDRPAANALREAVARLDDKDAEIIGLRHHGGLSFAQIAEMLDEPLGTVLARHHRALKKIKKDLESRGMGARPSRGEPQD